jgi:flagellar biogenesis protein FliO
MLDNPGFSLVASSLGSLLVIFGVLIAATLLVRRLRGSAWSQRNADQAQIKLIASRPLGGQNALLIVEAQGQRFLIGAGRNGMTSIGRLDTQ